MTAIIFGGKNINRVACDEGVTLQGFYVKVQILYGPNLFFNLIFTKTICQRMHTCILDCKLPHLILIYLFLNEIKIVR